MLSLIEVKCPHCNAHGQIMLPPVGTIIIGPCPECQGLVVVFCGHVLPLDKDIMAQGTIHEKREHLVAALTKFIRERVELMIADEGASDDTPSQGFVPQSESREHESVPPETKPVRVTHAPISDEEVRSFSKIELNLLDNSDYFKTIFN